ncbi:tRNA(m(1)G37)methyltransferase [Nowakowskiella sp. JEL0407]|nr:tRNA(m(1)G37)methyltransferase [Nowakowskiella sp. JEL0407]
MRISVFPPINRGLTQIKPELFTTILKVRAVKVQPKHVTKIQKTFKRVLLDLPRTRKVVYDTSQDSYRLILLDPNFTGEDDLTSTEKESLKENEAELTTYDLTLDYDYWTSDQILRSIIPPELEVPSAFETIGHIAHLNLREQYEPYKKIIGQVILEKNKNLKTVVNKLDSIDHTFRFFQMELLAGENNMIAETRECGCVFRFDFSKVYWNSRLQGEHERLVRMFQRGDFICDGFAGVGPFAIPAGKKGCIVYANDLNPESFKYLTQNIKLNKLQGNVQAFNMDGGDFIRQSVSLLNDDTLWQKFSQPTKSKETKNPAKESSTSKAESTAPLPNGKRYFNHFVMNLPATAIEFLDAFQGLLFGYPDDAPLPMIHCHCFSKAEDMEADVLMACS